MGREFVQYSLANIYWASMAQFPIPLDAFSMPQVRADGRSIKMRKYCYLSDKNDTAGN